MFKNLDGFKKIKEDKDTAVMQHPKGHTITIAIKALPVIHRKQLQSLPIHKMAEGGKIEKYAFGTPYAEGSGGEDQRPPPVPTPPPQAQEIADPNAPVPTALPAPSDAQEPELSDDQPTAAAPQQASPPAVATPDQKKSPSESLDIAKIYGMEQSGITGMAKAEAAQAQQQKMAELDYQNSIAGAQQRWDNQSSEMVGHIKAALNDVQNGHINPNQYMENLSTPQKVGTAIGLFLGGFSTPFTHQANPAMEILNKQIDRDVEAQKLNQNTKLNVYHGYLEQYKNAAAAENMTRATQLAIYGSKIRQAAAESGSPLAMSRAKVAIGELQQKIYPLVLNAQLQRHMSKFNGLSPEMGSESEYQVALNSAQQINPALYKDAQEKYIPGVGVTKIPVAKEDIAELSAYKNLNQLAKEAQDFAQTNGRTFWGTGANQKANDLANNMRLQIGQLVNLKRINEYEAKKYDDLFHSPGAWNQGAAIQSFKDMRNDIAGKTQSLGNKLGIKPFRK